MADNVTLPGTGAVVAADEVGGAVYQRVKLALGADGAAADLAPGQGLMAASVPVAIASNQSAVAVSVGPSAAIVHGQKTVTTAGTEEALGSSTALSSGVRIKALHANTGWVYVGANPVTASTGFVLDAGEEVFLEVANLATVYIDVSVNGEGASYIGA
jgi:hypothetical protein